MGYPILLSHKCTLAIYLYNLWDVTLGSKVGTRGKKDIHVHIWWSCQQHSILTTMASDRSTWGNKEPKPEPQINYINSRML